MFSFFLAIEIIQSISDKKNYTYNIHRAIRVFCNVHVDVVGDGKDNYKPAEYFISTHIPIIYFLRKLYIAMLIFFNIKSCIDLKTLIPNELKSRPSNQSLKSWFKTKKVPPSTK